MSITQSISAPGFGGNGRRGARLALSDVQIARSRLYGAIFGFGLVVLATPAALALGLQALLHLPQPMFLPLGVAILAADLYLAVWLGRLFATAPRRLRLPRLADWRLPAGMGWKLAVILLAAPWPFDAAFALLGRHPQIHLQMIVLLLATAAALACLAVLLTVLAEAWRLLRADRR